MITCIVCGSNKVENRETKLCATHAREQRKAESTPLPKKRAPLRQVSAKMAERNAAKKEAFKVLDAVSQRCAACGTTEGLTRSHILTTKQFPQFEADVRNLEHLCLGCHSTYENDKEEAARSHPNWPHQLSVIKELAPEYYALLNLKHPTLYP